MSYAKDWGMNGSLKGKQELSSAEQLALMEKMQKLREAWLEKRARRVRAIQELHC